MAELTVCTGTHRKDGRACRLGATYIIHGWGGFVKRFLCFLCGEERRREEGRTFACSREAAAGWLLWDSDILCPSTLGTNGKALSVSGRTPDGCRQAGKFEVSLQILRRAALRAGSYGARNFTAQGNRTIARKNSLRPTIRLPCAVKFLGS